MTEISKTTNKKQKPQLLQTTEAIQGENKIKQKINQQKTRKAIYL